MTLNDRKLSEGGTFCVYDTQGLERVVPDSRKPKMAGTFEYWLNYFQTNPGTRYVSDGNKLVCTVPPSAKSSIDPQRLRSSGQVLQVYGEGGPGDKGNGASLSVQ
jgi:hypothetical protein